MKKLLLVAAILAAAGIQPATAQTTQTDCKTTTVNGVTRTVCTTSRLPPPMRYCTTASGHGLCPAR